MAYTVTIRGSGHQFKCPPDGSILAAGLAAGRVLSYNCRSGFCQMCKALVLEGEVGYKEMPLETYLSGAERARGAALLCQAHPLSDLVVDANELTGLGDLKPRSTPARVAAIDLLAPDVVRLALRLPMNENVFYLPGQHLGVLIPGEAERNYSIANACGSAGTTELELHIKRYRGGMFSERLFNQVKQRAILNLELPLGTFFLREDVDRPLIFLATRTGFAPIKAMIEAVLMGGTAARRPINLYWGGRRRADLYMDDLARGWARDTPGFAYTPLLSRPGPDCHWDEAEGYIQHRVIDDHPDLSGFDIYACGSPAMIRDAKALFVKRGMMDPSRYFADEFTVAH